MANLTFIWMVFKNYQNVFLLAVVQNLLITVLLDNFVVKPMVLFVLSFVVRNSATVDAFIDEEIQICEIIHSLRVIKRKDSQIRNSSL